jgi:DNA replication protein DnaC
MSAPNVALPTTAVQQALPETSSAACEPKPALFEGRATTPHAPLPAPQPTCTVNVPSVSKRSADVVSPADVFECLSPASSSAVTADASADPGNCGSDAEAVPTSENDDGMAPRTCLDKIRRYCDDVNVQSDTRSQCAIIPRKIVIMVGKSGMGKSTMMRTLLHERYEAKQESAVCDTKTPEVYNMVIERTNGNKMTLTIMDTPGLFERDKEISLERTNEMLRTIIAFAAEKSLTDMNMIFICHKYGEKMSDENFAAIKFLIHMVGPEMQKNCGFLITRCDNRETEIEKYITDLAQTEMSKEVFRFFEDRVYLFGANDYTTLNNARRKKNASSEAELFQSVERFRELFIDDLFSLPEPSPIGLFQDLKRARSRTRNSVRKLKKLKVKSSRQLSKMWTIRRRGSKQYWSRSS